MVIAELAHVMHTLIISLIIISINNLIIRFKIIIAELAHVMQTLGDKLSTDETKVD